jgi:hypothetical protein
VTDLDLDTTASVTGGFYLPFPFPSPLCDDMTFDYGGVLVPCVPSPYWV